MLSLSLKGAFVWLRTLLWNYPTFSRCATYFLSTKTCVNTHPSTCTVTHVHSIAADVTTYIAMCVWVGGACGGVIRIHMQWGELKKDGIPICPCHMFSAAPSSSLFGTMDSSQRAKQTCKYTHFWIRIDGHSGAHTHHCVRRLSLRCQNLTKGSTNDLIKDATPSGAHVCAWWTQRCRKRRAKINCVLFSSPVRSVYLYIDGCLAL